jgi:hypothetical protein
MTTVLDEYRRTDSGEKGGKMQLFHGRRLPFDISTCKDF